MSSSRREATPLVVRAWTWLGRRFGRARVQLDEGVETRLAPALAQLGAHVADEDWSVAGAVERTRWTLVRGNARATLTCYSDEPAVLTGDAALVEAIARALKGAEVVKRD
jgi:hypothetical protein